MSDSLTFRLLVYIKAVAEAQNFTRAASQLYLAQPSLSHQIRELESQLKLQIFERGGPSIRVTDAGRLLVAYADTALRERDEIVAMAQAIYLHDVPPLRLGFSSFIQVSLLQTFRESYEELFPGCEIRLSGGDPSLTLQRLNERLLDCAILPMPIDESLYKVQQIARSPLVVCMLANDPLESHAQVDIREVAPRLKIFRDPELDPLAHARLVELFKEAGVPLLLGSSARTPSDMQWMVKAGYQMSLRLGVSYEALARTLHRHGLLTNTESNQLLKVPVKQIKQQILNVEASSNLPIRDWRSNVWLLTEADQAIKVIGEPDDLFIVRLQEKSTAGYLWNMNQVRDAGFDVVADRREAALDDVVGQDVTRILTAHISEPLFGALFLPQARPWNPSDMVSTFSFTYDFQGREVGVSRFYRETQVAA